PAGAGGAGYNPDRDRASPTPPTVHSREPAGESPPRLLSPARPGRHRAPSPVPSSASPLVRPASTGPPVAPDAGPLSRPRLGGHAPADSGGPGHSEVPRVPRPVPDARSARLRRRGRRQAGLVSPRLQHPAGPPPRHRLRGDRPLRRPPPRRRGCPP